MNLGIIGTLIVKLRAEGAKQSEKDILNVEKQFTKAYESMITKSPSLVAFLKRWGVALGAVSLAAGSLYTLIKMGPVAYSYFEELGTILGEISDIIALSLSPITDRFIDLLWKAVDAFEKLPAPIHATIGAFGLLAASISSLMIGAGIIDMIFGTAFVAKLAGILKGIYAAVSTSLLAGVAAGIGIGLTAVWLLDKLGVLKAFSDAGKILEEKIPTIFNLLKIITAPLGALGSVIINIVRGNFEKILPDLKRILWDETFKLVWDYVKGRLLSIPLIGKVLGAAGESLAKLIEGSYQTGTDYVPRTGPYLLHKGEQVVPAGEKGAGTQTFNMSFNITGGANAQELANEIVRIIQTESRRLAV